MMVVTRRDEALRPLGDTIAAVMRAALLVAAGALAGLAVLGWNVLTPPATGRCLVVATVMSPGSHDCSYSLRVGESFTFSMSVKDGSKYGRPHVSDPTLLTETDTRAGSLGPNGPVTQIDYQAMMPGDLTIQPYGITISIIQ
jgi:hypothetical protein